MANNIEERGLFFWRISSEGEDQTSGDALISGLLTISEKGTIVLALDRPLNHPNLQLGFGEVVPDDEEILGTLESGKYVAIRDLRVTSIKLSSEAGPTTFKAQTCLEANSSIETSANISGHLRIELAGLEKWLGLNALTCDNTVCESGDFEYVVRYSTPTFSSYADDLTVSVETSVQSPFIFFATGSSKGFEFRQTNWLVLSKISAMDVASLKSIYVHLEELLAVLLGEYFSLEWPFLVESTKDGDTWYRLYSPRGSHAKYRPDHTNTLVRFSSVRDSLASLFCTWRSNRQAYGPGYYLYIAGLRRPDYYIEHRFVNLIWALESLHRKKFAEPGENLKGGARVERILAKVSGELDRKDFKWLKSRLKHAENSLEDRINESFKNLPLNLNHKALRRFSTRCQQRRNQISHEGGPPTSRAMKASSMTYTN